MGHDPGHTAAGECDRMTLPPTRVCVRRSCFAFFVCLGLTTIDATAADITLPQANGGTLNLSAPVKRIVTLAPNLAA
jgi:hypothetical protein